MHIQAPAPSTGEARLLRTLPDTNRWAFPPTPPTKRNRVPRYLFSYTNIFRFSNRRSNPRPFGIRTKKKPPHPRKGERTFSLRVEPKPLFFSFFPRPQFLAPFLFLEICPQELVRIFQSCVSRMFRDRYSERLSVAILDR